MDDHRVTRMGLKMMLNKMFKDSDVHEAENFSEALDCLVREDYNLLILDLGIPGGGNTQMIDIIRRIRSTIPILIYTAADETKLAIKYLKAGATGFLSKNALMEEHRMAFSSVIENKIYISARISQFVFESFSKAGPINKRPGKFPLTSREVEVAELLIQGKWTNEISILLGLKPSTVSTFKTKIFAKVGVTNSVDLFKKLGKPETTPESDAEDKA